MSERIFVGLGANLGDAMAAVQDAVAAIAATADVDLVKQSALYRSSPWGDPDQPEFVNAVVELRSSLTPHEILDRLVAIEDAAGRLRSDRRWGPRVLDLDLLAHGDRQSSDPDLELPHPRIHERRFVLKPWHEIAPEFAVPGMGSVFDLLSRCTDPGDARPIDQAEES